MSIATGTRLGQYEVQDFIGQGAMGLVYRAYHADLERTGAVKVLQAITPDTDTIARFRHEAQAIAQLRHPNIVNVYDFGAFQGMPYMIVEYIPGGSLADRMAHGSLDQATAIRYLRGIAAGLDYAHGHGVVHRDVKPANVLLSAEDTPVLADFGLAKLLQGSSLKSMTGVTTGTPAYMAPEQVAGHQVGPAADRYSLATIAYEMLTGVIPFDGEALMELLYAQVHREPMPPSSRLPTLSASVDGVILRGLAKDPAARWESCTAFVDALAGALGGGPAPVVAETMVMPPAMASTVPIAKATPRPRKAPDPQAATVAMAYPDGSPVAASPAQAAKPKRRVGKRTMLGIAAAVILVLLLGLCTVLTQATTLAVSPTRAARGDIVTVTASHVPANQVGEIQLWSVVHTFPFRADSNGNVQIYMTVPRDVALGDHTVKICWSNACHKETGLRVVAGIAEVLPTPVADQSPGSSPSPGASGSPSPGATPTATPSHSTGSTPRPTSNPTSTPPPPPPPSPSPPPPPNPCPGNSNAPSVTPASQAVLLNGNATINGSNFTPNSNVTISYYAPSGTLWQTYGVVASCTGTFSKTFPTRPALVARTDTVSVCDVKKGCVSATINILL